MLLTCCQDHKASSWQISAPARSAAAPAGVAALPSPSGFAPVPVSFPALCASFPSPTSLSPSALCPGAAFGIPAVPAPSGASVSHPAREWLQDAAPDLVFLSL